MNREKKERLLKKESLDYHEVEPRGKIKVVPTKPHSTAHELSLAYSPGVAYPCLEIAERPEDAYRYTSKGNLVAVISNGTAVLGLGNIGALASKPVMEGKGLLLKTFADIDVFDIEVDTEDPEAFIDTVVNIAKTFGGINLEDIKAPECFEIERRIAEATDIPVMHDDQHGTAIISAAALLNAVELQGKELSEIKVVVIGAGASAIACANHYVAIGVSRSNISMVDSKGIVTKARLEAGELNEYKAPFAHEREPGELADALKDADVMLGLSRGGLVSKEMISTMAPKPIVFALANPTPEILPEEILEVRTDAIIATGRSDYPNQVNNVLGFPYIFRGALDVRARDITQGMKMAATRALAALAKEPVPDYISAAYDGAVMQYGPDYIIPKPFDPRLITTVPPAVAKAAIDSGVATEPIEDWDRYREELENRLGNSQKMVRLLHDRAKAAPKRLVFAEADHMDVLKAAQIVHEEGIAQPILLGNKAIIEDLRKRIEFDAPVEIIDPKEQDKEETRKAYASLFWNAQNRKGYTLYDAHRLMRERNYFASMMIKNGDADAMISGYSRNYRSVVKPILETTAKAKGVSRVAATNLMLTKSGPLFLSDTTINVEPSAKELAKIAQMSGQMAKIFGLEPIIAMLSFSNFGSSRFAQAKKVTDAVSILHRSNPDLIVDGPIQSDFALNKELLQNGFPFSSLSNKKVNVLVFPNLDAANITYKLMKELNEALSIGPILMGLSEPIHILQLGASVAEIVNMSAVAVVDAQTKNK